MSEKPHCAGKVLDGRLFASQERVLGKIKNFNQIFRHFAGEILEIKASRTGSIKYRVSRDEKAMKMQVIMDVCTVEASQCIQ
jgi:hypothetical protein